MFIYELWPVYFFSNHNKGKEEEEMKGEDLGEHFLTKLGNFREGPGQEYPKPASLYDEFEEVEEAKGVCKDRSKWKEVISAYPKGIRA
jgi:hypothetical protein